MNCNERQISAETTCYLEGVPHNPVVDQVGRQVVPVEGNIREEEGLRKLLEVGG